MAPPSIAARGGIYASGQDSIAMAPNFGDCAPFLLLGPDRRRYARCGSRYVCEVSALPCGAMAVAWWVVRIVSGQDAAAALDKRRQKSCDWD